MNIDTAEVRRVARDIGAAAGAVGRVARGGLRRVESNTPEYLEGATAEALTQSVGSLRSDVEKIASGLASISEELMQYAIALDAADAAAASYIQGN